MPHLLEPVLRRTALFSNLDEVELEVIARLCRQRSVPKGSILFYEDDPGTSCYILTDGSVKIVVNSQDGREHILGLLRPGDLFGEMSLLDGEPRSATAIAVEESKILTIQRDEFMSQLKADPTLTLKLLVVLTHRLRQTDRHVESLAFLSAPGRVARLLLDMAGEQGKASTSGLTFETTMTRQEMANLTGTSRETFTRVLMEYQDRGLVDIDRNQFTLRNETKLRELIV